MARVLIVDDEPVLVDVLLNLLARGGYETIAVSSGSEALSIARKELPDLIILDLALPDMDGSVVCRTLRQESAVPILMLTARDGELDKVLGLDLGADDYVTKPFSPWELLARVKALLRRADAAKPVSEATMLREGKLELDLLSHRANLDGKPLRLKPKEYDLLAFLMRHRGRAFSKEELLKQTWGYDDTVDTRTVVVHIRWLREKIEADPSQPALIETVRGIGYRFKG